MKRRLPASLSVEELEGWSELLAGGWFEPGDRAAALNRIAVAARIAFEADLCVLFAINPVTQQFISHPGVSVAVTSTAPPEGLKPPRREGLTRKVLEAGLKIVANPDTLEDPEASQFYRSNGIKKFAAIALRTSRRGRPMGVLYIDYRDPSAFGPGFEPKLGQFGRIAGRQLEVTWLLRRYQSVARLGREINLGISNEERLFKVLDERLGKIVDTSRCLIWAANAPEMGEVTFYFSIERGEMQKVEKRTTPDLEWLLARGDSIRLGNFSAQARNPFVSHISTLPLELPWPAQSVLFVPVKHGKRSLGFLIAISPDDDFFDDEDRNLFHLVSHHVALAVSNLRLFIRFRLLNETGQELARTKTNISQAIVDKVKEVTRADVVVLFPYSESTQQFEAPPLLAGDLLDRSFPQPRWVSQGHLPDLAIRLDEPLFLRSSSDLYRQLEGVDSAGVGNFLGREKIRSSVFLSLRFNREPIGAMFVNYRRPQQFDDAQQHLIGGLGTYAAIALKNDREYGEQARGHLEELELLQAIDRKLSASSDLQDLLRTILALIAEQIQPDKASILLYDTERDELVPRASIGSWKSGALTQSFRISDRKGIVVEAFVSGRPQLADDVESPRWKDLFLDVDGDRKTRCELDVPLMEGETTIGVLNLESHQIGRFREQNIPFLLTLAGQAVLAVRKAQAYEGERRLAKDNRDLFDLAKELTTNLDTEALFSLILERAIENSKAAAGVLVLIDRGSGDLVVAAERGAPPAAVGRKIKGGIIGWFADRRPREPINVDLTRDLLRRLHDPVVPGMQSEILVPLNAGSEMRGILNLESPNWWHFRERDINLLSAMADLAVIALQNAERFENARDRQQKLEALADISRQVVEQLEDPEKVLQEIVSYALHLTDASIADLDRFDDGKWVAHYRARKNEGGEVSLDTQNLERPGAVEPPRGIMTWVREHRKPILVEGDAEKDSRYQGEPGIHSEMATPLIDRRGNLLGVLDVTSEQFDAFDQKELEYLQVFADQAVIALEGSRNFTEAERGRDRLELLQEVGRKMALLSTLDQIEEAYEEVIEAAHREFQCTAVVRRIDGQIGMFVRAGYRKLGDVEPFLQIPVADSLGAWVEKNRKLLVIPDAENPPEGIECVIRSNPGDRSFVLAPIQSGDAYYGHLALSHPRQGFFLGADGKLVSGLAQELAITIRRLNEVKWRNDAEAQARDAEAVSEVGQYALDLMHRLGNDLGLVPSNLRKVVKSLAALGIKDSVILGQVGQARKDVQGVLSLAKNLGDEIAKGAKAERRLIPMTEILETALDELRQPNREGLGSIRIIRAFPATLPEVSADPNQMTTALLNLLVNACEAMPEGGELEVGAEESPETVRIWVRDSGSGIPEGKQARVFRLGYTTKPQGTGFGLWSVKRTILNHGATIDPQSEPGKGTVFTIVLPRAKEGSHG